MSCMLYRPGPFQCRTFDGTYRRRGCSGAALFAAVYPSVFGVQAHRAVLDPGVVEQRDLVDADRQQRAPVLAEPAFRVTLADEDGLLQVIGGDHGAVRLLVPPRPGHTGRASLMVCARDPG